MQELSWGYGGGVFTDAGQRSAYYVRGTKWVGFEIEETLVAKSQVGAVEWGGRAEGARQGGRQGGCELHEAAAGAAGMSFRAPA